jgi:hypothetical protein
MTGAHNIPHAPKNPKSWKDPAANTDSKLDQVGDARAYEFFQGTFAESFNALVTSDGTTVTMSLEQSGGGDLTMTFSDGLSTLDCTPAATIALTAGSDTAPTENFVYVLQSTKALTVSTSDWPNGSEHIKVAYFLVPSATFVQNNGTYINQNWNDHRAGTDGQGHMSHMAERIRRDGAYYQSGIGGGGTTDYVTITTNVGTPDNVTVQVNAGVIFQMHRHAYTAKDTSSGDMILVVNDNATAYDDITDLNTQLTDADGDSMSGKYFNLVLWGVANKGGEYGPLMLNLPTGSYNVQSDATGDVDGFDVFTIPAAFDTESSTGFLIARITLRHQAASGGTWTHVQTTDLRGTSPQVAAAGGTSGTVTEFSDNQFKIFDDGDVTKVKVDQVSNYTTATTRTVTWPDSNMDLTPTDRIWGTNNTGAFDAKSYSSVRDDLELNPSAKGDSFVADGVKSPAILSVGSDDQIRVAEWRNQNRRGYFTYSFPSGNSSANLQLWNNRSAISDNTNVRSAYSMVRAGSLTGIATWMDVNVYTSGDINITVYKNGATSMVTFTTGFASVANGLTAEVTYPNGTHTFAAGDQIRVQRELTGTATTDDMNITIEVEYDT